MRLPLRRLEEGYLRQKPNLVGWRHADASLQHYSASAPLSSSTTEFASSASSTTDQPCQRHLMAVSRFLNKIDPKQWLPLPTHPSPPDTSFDLDSETEEPSCRARSAPGSSQDTFLSCSTASELDDSSYLQSPSFVPYERRTCFYRYVRLSKRVKYATSAPPPLHFPAITVKVLNNPPLDKGKAIQLIPVTRPRLSSSDAKDTCAGFGGASSLPSFYKLAQAREE